MQNVIRITLRLEFQHGFAFPLTFLCEIVQVSLAIRLGGTLRSLTTVSHYIGQLASKHPNVHLDFMHYISDRT